MIHLSSLLEACLLEACRLVACVLEACLPEACLLEVCLLRLVFLRLVFRLVSSYGFIIPFHRLQNECCKYHINISLECHPSRWSHQSSASKLQHCICRLIISKLDFIL